MTSPTMGNRLQSSLGVAITLFGCSLAVAQPERKQVDKQTGAGTPATTYLTVAFPKTYSKNETFVLYGDFLQHLEHCASVRIVDFLGSSVVVGGFTTIVRLDETELLEGLKHGKVQMALLTAGLVPVATEKADAMPYAVRGHSATGKIDSYRLNLIVRADSPYIKPTDLVGRTVAHTTPGSNSGNLAPRAYFPGLGLRPDTDYTVIYSKGHERSIMGVFYGFYAGAAVASDQLQRMVTKGEIRKESFRILWESPPFPTEAWVLSSAVNRAVQGKISQCTMNYQFPPNMRKLLDGADTFLPTDAQQDFNASRFVIERTKGLK